VGIRLSPGGVLWNVSGLDAVELSLDGGRRFRVGTDEPRALAAAIAQAKDAASPVTPRHAGAPSTGPRVGWAGVVVLSAIAGFVGWSFFSQVEPPGVAVGAAGFEVRTPFYGHSFAAADVTAISLEERLPRILARTNGFAGRGSRRGHFRLEGLGQGRLYLEEGHPPYVIVRLREGFVILGFREPGRARALYGEMARAWPDRLAPLSPPAPRPSPP
jgi:hypothetical protein